MTFAVILQSLSFSHFNGKKDYILSHEQTRVEICVILIKFHSNIAYWKFVVSKNEITKNKKKARKWFLVDKTNTFFEKLKVENENENENEYGERKFAPKK